MKMLLVFALFAACTMCASPATAGASDEAQIRKLLDDWAKAFHDRDINRIMAMYAPNVVAFDIVPPLQFVGADAYRKDYEEFMAQYEGPIEVEYRDLKVTASGAVGFATLLERISGTLKGGQKSDIWVRCTSGFQKIHGKWKDVHDHVSVPADFDTGKAVLDLKP